MSNPGTGIVISPRRPFWMILGIALFAVVYLSAPWADAIDPSGTAVTLSHEGKAAIALFLFAVIWWVTEVIPIGVTSIGIAVLQVLFLIRAPREAFTDFMDPSVWFIVGSLVIGRAFSKTGLTKRIAYRVVILAGERTRAIYLACFLLTATLTLVMAHTAAAAAVFPILMTIYMLYEPTFKPTRFGKGLFIGMAFAAGAGSVITLLGAARGAVALGLFKDYVGVDVSFFELSWYMAPLGWLMVLMIWIYIMVIYPPERDVIPGLRDRAHAQSAALGRPGRKELISLGIVVLTVGLMLMRSFVPAFAGLNRSGVIMGGTVLFFLTHVLDVEDLEELPWNIFLLFGGAMSLGLCLKNTGAAQWMALIWMDSIRDVGWFWFVMGSALLVLIMTNLVVNVAAIAIILPVTLSMAGYLGVAPELILFSALAMAGMPFLFLIGAAPNAIAYESRLFTVWEFFRAGIPASLLLLAVLAVFVKWIWPWMGMPILAN